MREAKPYFKKSHKAWYYNENGKPVRLDENKKTAHEIWNKPRSRERGSDNLVDNPNTLVADLVAEFLDWAERKASTYDFYQKHCESFCQRYKTPRIMDLRNLHVTYREQAMGRGAEASAIAYIYIRTPDGKTRWGAGVDTSIELASIKAVLSALNRL